MEFLRYPQVIRGYCNRRRFGPPVSFTSPSACPWIGHPVSGLWPLTRRPIKTRFPFGSTTELLNLASDYNSPDHSTKGTPSHFNVLWLLVSTRFQVLFHSPPGVLFTFPSRYCFTIGHQVVFSLGKMCIRDRLCIHCTVHGVSNVCSHIRKSPDHWLCAPTRSLSQLITSFIGS